jgi:hypothetical protein
MDSAKQRSVLLVAGMGNAILFVLVLSVGTRCF